MIRRDYILRMIEEFIQVLSKIRSLKRGQLWPEASETLDEQFQRLIAADAAAATQLSDTELIARLINGEPTQAVRDKTLILTTVFKEAGDVAMARGATDQGCALHLKSLHLLLDVLAREEPFEFPEFVPRVDALVAALQDSPLPLETNARLMQHYERLGEFGRAEDCLFALMDQEPGNSGLAEFGIAFYERIARQSDATLLAGNLPRAELEAGLLELKNKTKPGQSRIRS